MSKIGYARVSTTEQNLDRQIAALKNAGVKKIFSDKQSGKDMERPELQKMLHYIRDDDIVFVMSLDRLSRNADDITMLIQKIKDAGASFQSLDLPDFSSIPDRGLRNMLTDVIQSVFKFQAESERLRIRERQAQGIKLAKERGIYKGRPRLYAVDAKDPQKRYIYQQVCNDLQYSQLSDSAIARKFGINRSVVRYIKADLTHLQPDQLTS
ncbi:recombinase family protein [Furfurilactobacillus entadae]|uniref:recombinase family protein n=1 Tax=Furfurilactobacillus entadae TaxID=2922307 RepID=UPI0035E7A409